MNMSFETRRYWAGVYQRSGLRNYGLSMERFMTDPWDFVARFGVHDETFPKLREVDVTSAKKPEKRALPRTHHRRAPVIPIGAAGANAGAKRGK